MKESPPKVAPLFSVPLNNRSRTSEIFLSLAEGTYEGSVTLGTLTARLGDRTFGVFLILLAVFNIIPLVSIFAGLLVSLLGLQMAVGMRQASLPKIILNWELKPERIRNALLLSEPKIRAIEKYIRPRWKFAEAPVVDRINGLVIAILGIIIATPIPLTNIAPSMVIVIMGLGLLERDGMVQFFALITGVGSMALVYYLLFTTGSVGV